jgi:hypothetical protein
VRVRFWVAFLAALTGISLLFLASGTATAALTVGSPRLSQNSQSYSDASDRSVADTGLDVHQFGMMYKKECITDYACANIDKRCESGK